MKWTSLPNSKPSPCADRPARPEPNHRWRGLVTPAKRGKGLKPVSTTEVRTRFEKNLTTQF